MIIFLAYFQKKKQEEIFLWDLLQKIKIYLKCNQIKLLNQNKLLVIYKDIGFKILWLMENIIGKFEKFSQRDMFLQ